VAKFAVGVVDTGGKFATGVVDTGGNFASKFTLKGQCHEIFRFWFFL
jgi:hypothetical protein